MKQVETRRAFLAGIYKDLDHIAVASSVPKWPHAKETLDTFSKMLFTYMGANQDAVQPPRMAVLSAAWLGLALGEALNRPVWHEQVWGHFGDSVRAAVNQYQAVSDRGGYDDQSQLRAFAEREKREVYRFWYTANKLGWMMLSILAYSPSFRTAARTLDTDTWGGLFVDIDYLSASIEMFAKSRGIDWESVLATAPFSADKFDVYEIMSNYDMKFSHPHEYFLPLHGIPMRLAFEGRQQENVGECIFDQELFNSDKPENWPAELDWPCDPTKIPAETIICPGCKRQQCTTCWPRRCFDPLVEIIEFPERGRGVRALERIPENTILGEYVGLILPWDQQDDTVYNLEITVRGIVAGALCAKRFGNWTRYINHSCEYNTVFQTGWFGGRQRAVVVSTRVIEPFSEISIDYGSDYWTDQRFCLCKADTCRYSTVEDVKKHRTIPLSPKKKPSRPGPGPGPRRSPRPYPPHPRSPHSSFPTQQRNSGFGGWRGHYDDDDDEMDTTSG